MIHQSRITAGRERSYILVLISCVCSTMIGQYGIVHGVDWDYTVHGPPTWAADFPSCGGISQSPINIEPFKAHVAQPGFLKLWPPQTLSTNIPLTNDHFSLYFDMAARNVQLTSSSFWSNMRLLNVHLHAPSEHSINGVQYPLEAHYVFVPLDYTEKVNQNVPYELTVIGVLYSSSPAATSSDVIAFAAENAASLAAPGSSRVLSWVPKIEFSDTFYTYSGSLTTPPCSEIVNWFVSTEIMPAKTSDIESITALIRQLTNTNAGNARPVQALNGRDVKVRSFYSSD